MRLANLNGRAVLLSGTTATDVESASGGRFGPDPMSVFQDWEGFAKWSQEVDHSGGQPYDEADLQAPVPRPRQVFAIGLNYRDHADEASLPYPEHLFVFTKFPSCLAGTVTEVPLPSADVDYEAEVVVTIGREIHDVDETDALAAVAGYSVGQDLSERTTQLRPPVPQFSLGKSFPGFGPFGPAVVTPDELDDPEALPVRCVLTGPGAEGKGESGWVVQDGNSRDMIFPVGRILSDLSRIVTLYPGDIVFTGTPAGVGKSHGIAMRPGNTLTTTIEGIGTIRTEFVA